MKKEKLQIIIKIAIPVVIIVGFFGVNRLITAKSIGEKNETIIVDEDNSIVQEDSGQLEILSKEKYGNVEGFYENLGFINENEILISAGLSREDFYKKYPDKMEFTDKISQVADKDIEGELYRLNLSTLEREAINIKYDEVFSDLSSMGTMINFMREETYDKYGFARFKLYNFYNKSELEFKDSDSYGSSDIAKFSEFGNCLIYEGDEDPEREIVIYHIGQDNMIRRKIKDNRFHISNNYYSKDGSEVYCIATEDKGDDSGEYREGIYKVNDESEMEEVLVLPFLSDEEYENKDTPKLGSQYSVLDDGKRIILTATIKDKYGIYIYDVEEKKFYNVVQYEENAEKVDPNIKLFSVSPDESKIIYKVKNKEYSEDNEVYDLYAANIKENRFTNRVCISEKIKLCENESRVAKNSKFIKWNCESNKIIFFTGNEILEKNDRKFMDKNEINIITFK